MGAIQASGLAPRPTLPSRPPACADLLPTPSEQKAVRTAAAETEVEEGFRVLRTTGETTGAGGDPGDARGADLGGPNT